MYLLALIFAALLPLQGVFCTEEAPQELLDRFYPGIQNDPDYAGSFHVVSHSNETASNSTTPHQDWSHVGATIGVLGIYTIGPGHAGVKRAIDSCINSNAPSTNGQFTCANDVLYGITIHALGIIVGGVSDAVSWIWSNLAQRTQGKDELRKQKRSCSGQKFTTDLAFSEEVGFKMTCKKSCNGLNPTNVLTAGHLVQNAGLFAGLAEHNAGEASFHVFNRNNLNKLAYCRLVVQNAVKPTNCPAVITQSGC